MPKNKRRKREYESLKQELGKALPLTEQQLKDIKAIRDKHFEAERILALKKGGKDGR